MPAGNVWQRRGQTGSVRLGALAGQRDSFLSPRGPVAPWPRRADQREPLLGVKALVVGEVKQAQHIGFVDPAQHQ